MSVLQLKGGIYKKLKIDRHCTSSLSNLSEEFYKCVLHSLCVTNTIQIVARYISQHMTKGKKCFWAKSNRAEPKHARHKRKTDGAEPSNSSSFLSCFSSTFGKMVLAISEDQPCSFQPQVHSHHGLHHHKTLLGSPKGRAWSLRTSFPVAPPATRIRRGTHQTNTNAPKEWIDIIDGPHCHESIECSFIVSCPCLWPSPYCASVNFTNVTICT